ncbi:hypothetical protein Tco_0809689 [Tanacetum coccineum]
MAIKKTLDAKLATATKELFNDGTLLLPVSRIGDIMKADFYLTEVELNVIKTNLECLEVIGFSLFETQVKTWFDKVVADEEATGLQRRTENRW